MAYDGTIPALGNLISNDIPAIQENFSLLESAQVIDSGSTADGDYWRFENGLQICFFQDTVEYITSTAEGNVYESSAFDYNYPQIFNEIPIVLILAKRTAGQCWISGPANSLISATNTGAMNMVGATNSSAGYPYYLAIGRWK